MELKTEIQNINAWLTMFGGETPDKKPIFRLSWSDDQFEWRRGEFNIFGEDGRFMRTETGVRYKRKYNYVHERWILEKWAPQDMVADPSLPNVTNGDYIPFWVFEGKDGNYLEPTQKIVEFMFYMFMRQKKRTPQDVANEMKIKEDEDIKKFMDQIDTSPIGNALRMKEAVGYTKEIKNAAN